MSTAYDEVYQLALTLAPDERRRLVDALTSSPSGLSADTILKTLTAHADKLREMGVRRIGLFGSHVRGEAQLDSDIDLLVEMSQSRYSLFDVLRIGVYLEDVFGHTVDVIPYDAIRPTAKPTILQEVVYAEID
ncbi:MAG: nucleotidyltransferase family protein [Anaerolineae bacterium]|nr:nucleotidyltransferase family protein [Anaerolineae bacterium]